MSSTQFDHVTVIKNQMFILVEHVSAIPCNLKMERKTLGVILPTEQPLTFETHVPERMEIISGECRVKIADSNESELFRAGQSFMYQAIAFSKSRLMRYSIMFAT